MSKFSILSLSIMGLLMMVLNAGCGQKLPFPVVPAEGTLLYKGKPLANVSITFAPEKGRSSSAITDGNGKFVAIYTPKIKGVQTGKSIVTVSCAGKDGKIPGEKIFSKEEQEIQKKYGLGTAGFPVEITKADKNLTIDLQ